MSFYSTYWLAEHKAISTCILYFFFFLSFVLLFFWYFCEYSSEKIFSLNEEWINSLGLKWTIPPSNKICVMFCFVFYKSKCHHIIELLIRKCLPFNKILILKYKLPFSVSPASIRYWSIFELWKDLDNLLFPVIFYFTATVLLSGWHSQRKYLKVVQKKNNSCFMWHKNKCYLCTSC